MKSVSIQGAGGPRALPYLVESDGKTVWVHSPAGVTVGRFSAKGIDVHALPGSSHHCLDCRPGVEPWGLPRREEWGAFVESLREHYDIDVSKAEKLIARWA